MSSPIIGITTCGYNEAREIYLPGAYIDAVQAAGGTPILLPPNQPNPERLLDVLDGLVFSGGGDINPIFYGGSAHHTIYLVDEERDEFELALARLILLREIPVLGICRGMQILNVASGGDLVVHVPEVYGDRITHRLEHPRRPFQHNIHIEPKTHLASIIKNPTITVVSWHHQAVKTIPPVWRIAAQAEDGLIEAIEHREHPWMLGVQWHPEMSLQLAPHLRLFQALVMSAIYGNPLTLQ